MASTAQVPVEEYLKHFAERHSEYVDGVLVDKQMPTWMHAVLQAWISALIMRQYLRYLAGGEVHARLRDTEFRLPDIAAQLRSVAQTESYAERPPLLCVEILSPDDRIGAVFAKCKRYHDWGVPVCWVIDPVKRGAWSYDQGGEPTRQESVLEAGEIRLFLAEVFSVIDGQP